MNLKYKKCKKKFFRLEGNDTTWKLGFTGRIKTPKKVNSGLT